MLVIGARFNLIFSFGRPPCFNPAAKVIMVNIDPCDSNFATWKRMSTAS